MQCCTLIWLLSGSFLYVILVGWLRHIHNSLWVYDITSICYIWKHCFYDNCSLFFVSVHINLWENASVATLSRQNNDAQTRFNMCLKFCLRYGPPITQNMFPNKVF